MNLKSLALRVPSIRRLHEHRSSLLLHTARLEADLRAAEDRPRLLEEQAAARAGADDRLIAQLEAIEGRLAGLEQALNKPDSTEQRELQREIDSCRALAGRCIFVAGFARSSTSILQSILNTAPRSIILGEANFYLPKDGARFCDWYNAQHVGFRNQSTKSTHAPDFTPGVDSTWWQWLTAAARFYDVLGDKMAFSSVHLSHPGPAAIVRFFEARFFEARYVFLLRNPVDTLLSGAKLFGIEDDARLVRECIAWLRYVQLWADWIRNFPHTLTLVADDLGPRDVARLAAFTGLPLEGAESLLHDGNRRHHEIPRHFPTLAAHREELMEIFDLARTALSETPAIWQAHQKRSTDENDSRGLVPGQVAIVPRPLGHAWAKAEDLCVRLANANPPADAAMKLRAQLT
jgi:Sulfotransferase family